MFVVTTNDVLAAANQLMVKQLKNRDEDVNKNRKFVIGVDRNKMRLYDVVESEQTLVDAGQEESSAPKSQGKWDKYKLD